MWTQHISKRQTTAISRQFAANVHRAGRANVVTFPLLTVPAHAITAAFAHPKRRVFVRPDSKGRNANTVKSCNAKMMAFVVKISSVMRNVNAKTISKVRRIDKFLTKCITYRKLFRFFMEGIRCENSPCEGFCSGRGQCSMHLGSPQCDCDQNYWGRQCESEECTDYCQNGGTCTINPLNDKLCECAPYYSGQRCEIFRELGPNANDCSGFYCDNGGTCHVIKNEAYCNCTAQFTGPKCQVNSTKFGDDAKFYLIKNYMTFSLLQLRRLSDTKIHALITVKMVLFVSWMSPKYIQLAIVVVSGRAQNAIHHRHVNIIVAIALMAAQSMNVCKYQHYFICAFLFHRKIASILTEIDNNSKQKKLSDVLMTQ